MPDTSLLNSSELTLSPDQREVLRLIDIRCNRSSWLRIRLAGLIPESRGSELRVLRKMIKAGLIEQVPERGPRFTANDRIYRLTDVGRGALSTG